MTWRYFEEPRADVQALVDARGLRCLDVGCGDGALSSALKEAGAAYVAGVEVDADAAPRARDRLDVVVEGSILDADLPFEESEFDLIVFAGCCTAPLPAAAGRRRKARR
jgi:SAM-dependent methyltransferase